MRILETSLYGSEGCRDKALPKHTHSGETFHVIDWVVYWDIVLVSGANLNVPIFKKEYQQDQ